MNVKSLLKPVPKKWILYTFCTLAAITLSWLIYSPYIPKNYEIKEGDKTPTTIVSPKNMLLEDPQENRPGQSRRISLKIFTIEPSVNKWALDSIDNFFEQVQLFKSDPLIHPEPSAFIQSTARLDDKMLQKLRYHTLALAESLLKNGLLTTQNIQTDILKASSFYNIPPDQIVTITAILTPLLKPNVVYNTDISRHIHLSKNPVKSWQIRKGEPIIYKDEIVTKKHLHILQSANLINIKPDYLKFFGTLIITLALFVVLERYLFFFHPELHEQPRYFALIYCIMLVVVGIARFFENAQELPYHLSLLFLVPIPISAMILSFLSTARISFLCGTLISIMVTLSSQLQMEVFLYLFLSQCMTIFISHTYNSRLGLIKSGYWVGMGSVIIVCSTGLITSHSQWVWYVSNGLLAFLNGIFSSMIALAILPYLEMVFGITTRQTYLELTNLDHPLLKKLLEVAPGTYQHSLMVANLAESACEALNVDPILGKVGAYFHDIGKIKRPGFFTENQFTGQNPHDGISPRMSKLIIASHVKEGIELAIKHKLPKKIQDMIAQHHGTTVVFYFYSQAIHQEKCCDLEATKDDFRYAGPKPQFKESAILMLADSVEAASQSLEKPSLPKIEALVEKIFKEKIEEHQFDDCGISLQELDKIKERFLKVFKSRFHTRVDYDDEKFYAQ